MEKLITASIVVHGTNPHQLLNAIDCLQRSKISLIYIIDNSEDDNLRKIIEGRPNLEYHKVKNEGFGAGHNIAIKKSIKDGVKYHLVMNADVWWEGDIISELIKKMESDGRIGLISPKIFYPDGVLQYTCRKLPTPWDVFSKRFLPSSLTKSRMRKYLIADHDHDFSINCPYLLGSFMLFRVEALKKEGLFDERFFMYPEDIDITRRLHKNWVTLYWPEVSIVHEHQAASRKNLKMLWVHSFNMIKYFNKWGWTKDAVRKKYNTDLTKQIKRLPASKVQIGRG